MLNILKNFDSNTDNTYTAMSGTETATQRIAGAEVYRVPVNYSVGGKSKDGAPAGKRMQIVQELAQLRTKIAALIDNTDNTVKAFNTRSDEINTKAAKMAEAQAVINDLFAQLEASIDTANAETNPGPLTDLLTANTSLVKEIEKAISDAEGAPAKKK
jgi:hypothetical protein